jgi:ABC-2 type transport system ATP-binding protein
MTHVISAEHLQVERGGKAVLKDVSFTLPKQQILALIGGNGAGKSTAILSLLGLLPLSGGTAHVLGHDVSREAQIVRARTGYLPELAALYDHFSALENARYFLSLAGVDADDQTIEHAFKRVSLPERAWNARAETFSKGMRQKVAIAACLLRKTDLILFDEPTSGLDPAAIDEFHAVIEGLREAGTSILMVTHDLFGACETADQILLLSDGGLVGDFARTNSGFDQSAIRSAFAQQAAL